MSAASGITTRATSRRTIPVSGHFDADQREVWTIFIAAYKAGSKALKAGATVDQVFDAWQKELMSHRGSAKSSLARRAIESWSNRAQVPFWQIHTSNLDTGSPNGPLGVGTTINFEPIASIDGQGFFLEDKVSDYSNRSGAVDSPECPIPRRRSKQRCGNDGIWPHR